MYYHGILFVNQTSTILGVLKVDALSEAPKVKIPSLKLIASLVLEVFSFLGLCLITVSTL